MKRWLKELLTGREVTHAMGAVGELSKAWHNDLTFLDDVFGAQRVGKASAVKKTSPVKKAPVEQPLVRVREAPGSVMSDRSEHVARQKLEARVRELEGQARESLARLDQAHGELGRARLDRMEAEVRAEAAIKKKNDLVVQMRLAEQRLAAAEEYAKRCKMLDAQFAWEIVEPSTRGGNE